MVDPTDLVLVGGGGVTVGGLIVGLIRGLGKRSIDALDETIKALNKSVGELHNEIRHLRETDLTQGIHIGGLQQEVKDLKERVNGQGEHWQKRFLEYQSNGGNKRVRSK